MRKLVLIAALGLSLLAEAAKKPKGVPLYKRPNQVAEAANVSLPAPAQLCANWAWAAALEAMLGRSGVTLNQHYWVQKTAGGELCLDRPMPVREAGRRTMSPDILPIDLDTYAHAVAGNYTLDDGRKVTLAAQVEAGAPDDPGPLITTVRAGNPTLLFWHNRTYVIYGVVYDEYIYPTGQRMYVIKEMKLLDPLMKGEQQKVSFVSDKDDPAEIQGTMQVMATPVEGTKWIR